MRRRTEKDLYAVLGVDPDATAEEIRRAYIARARVLHPDRFDPQRQPEQWKQANEMLLELNEAYGVLRNPSWRAQYDLHRVARQRQQSSQPPPPPPAFEVGQLMAGSALLQDLPDHVQTRLLQRQWGKREDQSQIKLVSVAWRYIFIAALLCWFWYLFADAQKARWSRGTVLWYAAVTLAAGGLVGRNCVTILKWSRATLKPCLYVTPLYLWKTEYDVVSFWPIWKVKEVSVTHHHVNGIYAFSTCVIDLQGDTLYFWVRRRKRLEEFLERLRTYQDQLRAAYARQDYEYFWKNDEFRGVAPSRRPPTSGSPGGRWTPVYAVSVFFSAAALLAAIHLNRDLPGRELARYSPAPVSASESGALPRDLPTRTFQPTVPQVSPAQPPTPVEPSLPQQPLPASGEVQTWTEARRVAPFKIEGARGSHRLLKLVEWSTGSPVMTVFVRKGTTVEVEVPLGTYEVRFACGQAWYGYEHLFGPETSCRRADRLFSFEAIGGRVTGFMITLYRVPFGNLPTSPISLAEF